jgi:hypothetical protein
MHDHYIDYVESKHNLDSNSAGPELAQERANELAHRQQNSPEAGSATRGRPPPGTD